MFDLFISHASEDKADFVQPLALFLRERGVRVWYDEFELKVGDSLSQNIDKGLKESRYGVIVLSKSFFNKGWTEYELQSMIAKAINDNKTILPIWHEIGREEILKYSLYLADKFALSTKLPLNELGFKIIEVVRPDILNSNYIRQAYREIKANAKGELVEIPFSKIVDGPIIHKSLPVHLVIASRLISEVFYDIFKQEFEDMLMSFARDADYDHEFIVWSAMANTYVQFIRETNCPVDDIERKREAFSYMLKYSVDSIFDPDRERFKYITKKEYVFIIANYQANIKHLMSMANMYSGPED